MSYTELQVTTNFTFLRGASHPEELVEYAAALGYKEIAITDRNSFAGIVRGHVAAKKKGIRIIPGCRLDLIDGLSLLAYPMNIKAYAQLCTLLTKGNLRTEKGECHLFKQDIYEHAKDIKFIAIPPDELNQQFDFDGSFKKSLAEYADAFGEHLYIAASKRYKSDDSSPGCYFVLFKIIDHYHCRYGQQI